MTGFCAQRTRCSLCAVRSTALCAAIEDAALDDLAAIVTPLDVVAGRTIVEEGAARQKVFSVTAGMLRLIHHLHDGRRQIVGFLRPGDYLGLADDRVYAQTAEAVVASRLCAFRVDDMARLMVRHPRLNERLLGMTKTALRQARDAQAVLGRSAPLEKLAFFLVTTAAVPGCTEAAAPVSLPMPRADIADYLGLTIETVSRSFTKLCAQRLIRLADPWSVVILDRPALQHIADRLPPDAR